MDKEKMIPVTSRAVGTVGYKVPELGVRRIFNHRETKEISFRELESLSFLPGGRTILEECLVIKDEEAARELLPNIEPEYFYGEKEIEDLMKNGSLDAFLDCLDFAPQGVLDIIKKIAVDLPLNDVSKRDAIRDKLDFDVTKAIEIKNTKFDDGSEDTSAGAAKATRRVATPGASAPVEGSAPARRVIVK